MKRLVLKFLTVICVWFLTASIADAQTDMVRHIVGRGETLASIAKRYAVTEERIIELNPDAAKFVYVGMQLVIPVTSVMTDSADGSSEQKKNESAAETSPRPDKDVVKKQKDNNFNRWGFNIHGAYGISPGSQAGAIRANGFVFSITPGFTYSFTKSFYIGAGIGYYGSYVNIYSTSYTISMNQNTQSHMIQVPVEAGYRLHLLKDRIFLAPYAGIDSNIIVRAVMEQHNGSREEIDVGDNRFSFNGRVGLRLNLWGFSLGAAYLFPFKEGKGYPEISIGFVM